jgi:hypothetical protein
VFGERGEWGVTTRSMLRMQGRVHVENAGAREGCNWIEGMAPHSAGSCCQ